MHDEPKKTYWSVEEASILIRKYCAFQERCHKEVRQKLLNHGIYGDQLEETLAMLITGGFLDEERFARSFARGKFRMNQWGRNKIKNELKFRQVTDYCIRAGLSEIDEQEYREVLTRLLLSKLTSLSREKPAIKKQKLVAYALSRGFEFGVISDCLEDVSL